MRSTTPYLLLAVLCACPAVHAATPPPSGPPQEDLPAAPAAAASPAEPHPGGSGDAVAPAAVAVADFQAAVEATAQAEPPAGLRFHVQGELLQTQPPGDGGEAAPPAADDGSGVPPPTDGPDALAPGDLVTQFQGLSNTGWIPPDTILAVGPTSVVEAVNSGFAVYDKTGGTLLGYTTFSSFLAPALPAGWQGSLFDPRVVYSPEHSRFVMLVLGRDAVNQTSVFFVVVSQTSNPTGSWWIYSYLASAPNPADADAWADYCGLGADTWGAYVTCNLFYWTGSFKHAKLWSLSPAIFTGGAGAGWGFWDLRWNNSSAAFSLQPAQPYGVAGDAATFFTNTFSASGNTVLLWKLTGDRTSSPTLTRATIGTLAYDAIGQNVDQPGSTTDLDGGDARVMNAAYKQRKVYTVLTTDPANDGRRSGWLLLKLDVDTNSLDWQTLLHTTTPAASGGFYYFYPALALDGAGGDDPNVAVFGSWTDTETSVTASTRYASGLFKIFTDQPAGSGGPFIGFVDGVDWYVALDGAGRNRWGDYSGAAYDWTTGKMWGAVETAGPLDTWRTYLRGMDVAGGGCTPDGFEPDGSSATAKAITSGVAQSRSLCPAGDADWVKLTLGVQSGVVLETSGAAGDTTLTLYDGSLSQIDFDDDGGTGLFSRIDRTCGSDPLASGTYYVVVEEFGDLELDAYDLDFTGTSCATCATDLTVSNTTVNGAATYRASQSVTLGPSLLINGSPVRVYAGQRVVLRSGTQIGGTFSATVTPSACTAAPAGGPPGS